MDEREKYKLYFQLCSKWLYLKNMDINLKSHYMLRDKRVAIYGIGDLGNRLLEEFYKTSFNVEYVVDKQYRFIVMDCNLYSPNDDLPDADIMIVTVLSDYAEIVSKLGEHFKGHFISIEHIIDDLWNGIGEST